MSRSKRQPSETDAAESEAMFREAMQIAYGERGLLEALKAALERDDVPAVKAAARKLCDLKQLTK